MCKFLPDQDRRYLANVRQIIGSESDNDKVEDAYYSVDASSEYSVIYSSFPSTIQTISVPGFISQTSSRPSCHWSYGATGNVIRLSTAVLLDAKTRSTSQSTHQADGWSPLNVAGETRLYFTLDEHSVQFEVLLTNLMLMYLLEFHLWNMKGEDNEHRSIPQIPQAIQNR